MIACPGAGKTRIIVDRHCATPPGQATGRAIVSFTRVATSQIRTRAAQLDRLDLVEHPHVFTTLDGFLWRFLVRPFLPVVDGKPPWQRLDSWRQAPRQHRRFDYVPDPAQPRTRYPFDLTDFSFTSLPAPPRLNRSSSPVPVTTLGDGT